MTGIGDEHAADRGVAIDAMELDDALAGEAALGLTTARERARLDKRAARDPAFARRLSDWRAEFAALDEEFDGVAPPAYVKTAIDRRIDSEPLSIGDVRWSAARLCRCLWSDARVWRGATAAAAALLAAQAWSPTATPPAPLHEPHIVAAAESATVGKRDPLIVATLETEARDAQFVLVYAPAQGRFHTIPLRSSALENADYHLWILDEGAAPAMRIGPVDIASAEHELEPNVQEMLVNGAMIGLTIEPRNADLGATSGPQGPVVATAFANAY